MKFQNTLCFDDVLLKPRYSSIASRREISLKTLLGEVEFSLPVISSPMDTVTERAMATKMSALGGLGLIHRYNSPEEQATLVEACVNDGATNVGFAVGVGEDAVSRAVKCVNAGGNVVCIDVAHGHHNLVRHTIGILRNTFGTSIHIMAGNVATPEGHQALSDWGADSVRIGIGGGSICSTRIQTGHGMPTFQSVLDCAQRGGSASIIADGGIRNPGDVVKALAAGADAVMVGSLLAGTHESPGEFMYRNGEKMKIYRGMASKDAQIDWRGHYSSDEGVSSYVPCKGPAEKILDNISRGVRSGLSYSGCRSILELQTHSEFITQTSLGNVESGTHILNRG